MLLYDPLLIKGDKDMDDKKDNKPTEKDSPFDKSDELFESIFREELDALADGQPGKAAPKTDKKANAAKQPHSASQMKRAKPGKGVPRTGAKAKKIEKEKPVSPLHVDRPRRALNKPAAKTSTVVEKRPVSAGKKDAPEEIKPKKRAKMRKIKLGKIGSRRKIEGGSDKIKIALLSVLLVAAVTFIINSLGIVDFGGLLGFSEPTRKERIQPRVAKKPPVKTGQKKTRVAIEPPQKRTSVQAVDKTTSRKGTLVVKKPPQKSPSEMSAGTVTKSTKPTTTAKKPVITQQRYRPATPQKKPLAVQPPSKPLAPEQEPVVAKKPRAVARPKPPPVIKEPAKPVGQNRKKPTLAKEELFPEESALPHPYSIYFGSYQSLERAENAISEYRNKGLSAYWVRVNLGAKGVWYRVFTGYFKDQKEAEAFLKRKRLDDAFVKRTRYATLIGIYATEGDAQKKFLALSKIGYSPYVVETHSGESQVYVGAFYTKAGAEEQRSDLASKGVQSRVVER
jgi:cell division protein FtsN